MQRDCSCCQGVEVIQRNQLLRVSLRSDFGPCRVSRASVRSQCTNPRRFRARKGCGFVKISANHRACCTEQDAHIQNRLLRLALRNDFGLAFSQGHLGGPGDQFAPEKAVALSRYPRIMGLRLLHRAGCHSLFPVADIILDIDCLQVFRQTAWSDFFVFWYGLDSHETGKYCKLGDVINTL